MTTDDETLDDEQSEEGSDIRQLRSQAKEARDAKRAAQAAQEELAAVKREVEFRKAGIDPDDPKAKYFAKAYDGDLTAEAIRAEAEQAGILQAQEQQTPGDEQGAWQRTANAGQGATADGPKVDVMSELRAAKSPDEIAAIMERHGHDVQYTGPNNPEQPFMGNIVRG